MKFKLSLLLVAVIMVVPLLIFALPHSGQLSNEQRWAYPFPASMPKLRTKEIRKYFTRIDLYLADRFPARAEFLDLTQQIDQVAGKSVSFDNSWQGKEGWLFLGNGHERVLSKFTGNFRPTQAREDAFTRKYLAIYEACRQRGAQFAFLIGPNKLSVYPEYRQDVLVPVEPPMLDALVNRLKAAGMPIVSPAPHLKSLKAEGPLYYKTDTHWNEKGAALAFAYFLEQIGLPPLPPHSFKAGPPWSGDLLRMGSYPNFILPEDDNLLLVWDDPALREDIAPAFSTSGKSAWVFGDSFATALKDPLAATFKDMTFFGYGDFPQVMASGLPTPDMIVWIMVERDF